MPLYRYRCTNCDSERELLRTISNRHKYVECEFYACGFPMELVIEAPQGVHVKENIFDRVNNNWQKRREKKAKGELLE